MSWIWPNKFQNIFEVQRSYQTNIHMYSEGGKATNMNTLIYLWRPFYWNINIKICVFLPKEVKTYSNWSYIAQVAQEWSAYSNIIQEMGLKKYPKIFRCPRIEQQISKYIQMVRNWMKEYPNKLGSRKCHKYEYKFYLLVIFYSNIDYVCSSLKKTKKS